MVVAVKKRSTLTDKHRCLYCGCLLEERRICASCMEIVPLIDHEFKRHSNHHELCGICGRNHEWHPGRQQDWTRVNRRGE